MKQKQDNLNSIESSLVIRHLSKAYGEKRVLEDISIEFPQGKTTVLMGPSGCGKTTLFRILAGLESQDSGEILGLRRPISMMFQEDRLIGGFSAKQNIELVTQITEAREVIRTYFQKLGLDYDDPKPVKLYSGGMKRRVALLRAILFPAKTILLDEPFKGLDEELKATIISFLKETLVGRTVIIISHDSEDAKLLAATLIEWPTKD